MPNPPDVRKFRLSTWQKSILLRGADGLMLQLTSTTNAQASVDGWINVQWCDETLRIDLTGKLTVDGLAGSRYVINLVALLNLRATGYSSRGVRAVHARTFQAAPWRTRKGKVKYGPTTFTLELFRPVTI